MEFKKRIFLLPSFGNFEQICKYLFPLVCLYFIFISFFLFLSTNNLQENISIREEFYIYLFIYSFLSLDGKLSDRRNIRKIEIVKTSLVKYPFHPFPLYFYRASHRKIILSLWRNGGKNNSCSLRSNLFEPFQPRSTTPSYYRDRRKTSKNFQRILNLYYWREEIAKKMEKGWREAERVPSESNIDQRRELSTILS